MEHPQAFHPRQYFATWAGLIIAILYTLLNLSAAQADRVVYGDGDEDAPAYSGMLPPRRPYHFDQAVTPGQRGNYILPVRGSFARRGFGYQHHPFGGSRMHRGQDIHASYGSDVWAAKSGVVVAVTNYCASYSHAGLSRRCGGGFGNLVVIRHADGNYTYYGHLQNSSRCAAIGRLRPGQKVSQGFKIGCVGSSGSSTGPHLHFEVRAGGLGRQYAVDPMGYLRKRRYT